jgi:hypothetical protein
VVDVPRLIAQCQERWYNQTLCKVNDSVIRLGVMQGEYHWHKHDHDDEFFFVLEGRFIIDLEGRSVELKPLEGFVVPKGVVHRTRAPQRAVILMAETSAIVPTRRCPEPPQVAPQESARRGTGRTPGCRARRRLARYTRTQEGIQAEEDAGVLAWCWRNSPAAARSAKHVACLQ